MSAAEQRPFTSRWFVENWEWSRQRRAIVADIALLIRLYERELDALSIETLKILDFPNHLGLALRRPQGQTARALLGGALAGLARSPAARMAQMRVDFQVMYWGPDRVDEQGRLRRAGDDVLARLSVIGELLGGDGGHGALQEAADHLERMIPALLEPLARDASARCRDPFYPGLALLSLAYAHELLELLSGRVILPRRFPREVACA